jgi:hypothetical protein
MLKTTPVFFNRLDYHSKDENDPDRIILRLGSLKTSNTEYSTNIMAEQNIDGRFIPTIFALKYFNSKDSNLLDLWNLCVKSKIFKKGEIICLLMWKKGVTRCWNYLPSKSLR